MLVDASWSSNLKVAFTYWYVDDSTSSFVWLRTIANKDQLNKHLLLSFSKSESPCVDWKIAPCFEI